MALLGRAADVLNRLRLGEPAFRLYQRLQAFSARERRDDPLLPPAYLRVLTAGLADPDIFMSQGRAAAAEFAALARRHGVALDAAQHVLEFGCGCGRVARWWAGLSQARFSGCDVNPKLAAWCAANLPGDFRATRLSPPLPYADGQFDLVYALSVFTHMHDAGARAWLEELGRVTRPGGLALFSFLDERMAGARSLAPALAAEGQAIRREGAEGGNLLSAYFTAEGFAARAAAYWRLDDTVPSDRSANGQAIAVFRRL